MARLFAISKTQIPAFCPAQRFNLVGIMHRQPARLRQGNAAAVSSAGHSQPPSGY
jgi:hypothetical protein